MNTKSQKEAFLSYEADNYFFRNKEVKYNAENDIVIKTIKEYGKQFHNVLEIGCSTGYRLNAITSIYPDAKTSGLEPSTEAINLGKTLYPQINFNKGTADDLSCFPQASFDLVIIGFVLYVVDREILFKVISETDRVLSNGGALMILDFFSEKPIRNPYQHIKDVDAFAFKQNYEDIFTASKLYHILDKRSVNHSTKEYDLSTNFYDKYTLTTLVKDVNAGYK